MGSERIVATAADKRALFEATGAQAVDMESHEVAAVAAAAGLPFLVIRALADPYDQVIPQVAREALRPDGRVRLQGHARRPVPGAGGRWRCFVSHARVPGAALPAPRRGFRWFRVGLSLASGRVRRSVHPKSGARARYAAWLRSLRGFWRSGRRATAALTSWSCTNAAGRWPSSGISGAIGPSVRIRPSADRSAFSGCTIASDDRGRLVAAMRHAVGAFLVVAGAVAVPVGLSMSSLNEAA